MPKKVEKDQRAGLAALAAIADGRQLLPDVSGTFIPRGRKYSLRTAEDELYIPMLAWQSRVFDALYGAQLLFGFVFDIDGLELASLTNYSATVSDCFQSDMLFVKKVGERTVELKFSQTICPSTVHYYVELTVKDAADSMLGWNTIACVSDSRHRPPAVMDDSICDLLVDNLNRFGLIRH